jgi:hypothetical protein
MAIPFLNDVEIKGNLDLLKNQLQRAVIHADSGEPTSPAEGQVCHNTSKTDTVNGSGKFGYRSSTKWVYPDMEKSVYDTDNDGVVNEAEEADTLDGQHGSHYLDRANHTGSPSGDVNWGNNKITNLKDPTADQDAANKRYVDGAIQGLSWKEPVRVATTENITLSGTQTIDGESVVAGDRVLVKNQTTSSANGIYIVDSSTWERATDANAWSELVSAAVFVEEGTAYGDTAFVCTVDSGGTLGSTAVTWVQFGGSADITAGDGLSKSGNELAVNVDDQSIEIATDTLQAKLHSSGALSKGASGLMVNVDTETIEINGSNQITMVSAYKQKKVTSDIVGDASTTIWTISHDLSTMDIVVMVYDKTTNYQAYPQIEMYSTSQIKVHFKSAPASGQDYRVIIIG